MMRIYRGTVVVFTVFFGLGGTASMKYKRQQQKVEPSPDGNSVMYNYDYAIEDGPSGVYLSRWEERRGSYTRGEYSLLEPGGCIRTVGYEVADGDGFKATVSTYLPGISLLSTQQFLKALELHPQPPLELDPIPPDESGNEVHTYNYHKTYHEKIGYRKIFGVSRHQRHNTKKAVFQEY